MVATTLSVPASRRRSCIPVEMYRTPCSLKARAAELSWSIDTERAGVPLAMGGGGVVPEQHGGVVPIPGMPAMVEISPLGLTIRIRSPSTTYRLPAGPTAMSTMSKN